MICILFFFSKNKKCFAFVARSVEQKCHLQSTHHVFSPYIESESYAWLRSYAHHFVDTVPSIYASHTSHICVQQAAVQSSREETAKCAKCEVSNVFKELTITQE